MPHNIFTKNQTQILAILINNSHEEYYLSELGEILGKRPGVFQRGINSLERQGIITSRRRGNQRLFKINQSHHLFDEIRGIVQKTYGAEGLVRDLVKDIPGIELALIYGSYAKNEMGPESDIDILIAASDLRVEDILLDRIKRLEQKLQREVNYKIYSKREFRNKIKEKDPFLEEVLAGKYILLKGKV